MAGAGGLHRKHDAAQSDRLPLSPAIYIPGVWGAGGTGCTGIVTTGPAAVKPGAAGTNCSTTGNQNSRFKLTIANPTQGNQLAGGGGGSVVVADSATANYNGLVSSLNHRLSSTFNLFANWTWSKCLNIEDAQGDLASTTVENPNNPRHGLRAVRLGLPAHHQYVAGGEEQLYPFQRP